MSANDLKYKSCDICGCMVSIGRNVCKRCCKEYGTVKFYIRTKDSNVDVRQALDRIKRESERSRSKDTSNFYIWR